MCYINAGSIKNKTTFLNDHISTCNYDIFAITGTWLNCEATNNTYINALLPPGYSIYHTDRMNEERGGCVALIYRQHIFVIQHDTGKPKQFEYLKCTVKLNRSAIDVIVFYRPPPSQQNNFTTREFMEEWSDFLSNHTLSKDDLIIVGDVNFHLENFSEHNTERFIQSLECHGLQQLVRGPTHHHGHTLDVLISRDTSTILSNIEVQDINLCTDGGILVRDHYAVMCNINHPTSPPTRQTVSYRKYAQINIEALRHDINTSSTLNNALGTADQLAQRYITGLMDLMNTHAPVIRRTVTVRPQAPWYNEPLRDAKRLRRRLERIWRRHKKEHDRQLYRSQCVTVVKEILRVKTEYYSNRISDSKGDTQLLFSITSKLLENQQAPKLPLDKNNLANKFSTFFHDKITNLRDSLAGSIHIANNIPPLTDISLQNLRPTTCDEVRIIIMSCTNKSCELDPVPSWLLKKCIEELLPLLTSLFNASLESGSFPQQFKSAIIRPLLKKTNLDVNELKNYRPVSNLHFISKVLEKLVVRRLEDHMSRNNLYDPLQSAYKLEHSTETALMKINNDVLVNLDQTRCTVLVSLDLSAAFDTVDHSIFISRMESLYNVKGVALAWFISYLENRDSRVCIEDSFSNISKVVSGVPQGSVLGARLYTIYTRPLSDIVRKHSVMFHSYADDTQVYLHCNNTQQDIDNTINRLQQCIADICVWMNNNALKLNTEKTEFIIFRPSSNSIDEHHLSIGETVVKESTHVRILGVTLDQYVSLERHITNTCRSANMHIRKIRSIRHYLTEDAVKTLVQSLVISRLDYCNSLLIGLPQRSIHPLQMVQNSAARLISRTSYYSHITPTLRALHWLHISKRCQFKILVITFKSLHNTAPSYLRELLNWYTPNRPLRSASTTSLVPNRNRTIRTGRRIFNTSSATLWNTLPNNIQCAHNIRDFKTLLKTFLFNL